MSETRKPFSVGRWTSGRRIQEMNTIYLISPKFLLLPSAISLANFIRRWSTLRTRLQSPHHLFSIRIQHRKDISLDTRRAYLCACLAFAFGFSLSLSLARPLPFLKTHTHLVLSLSVCATRAGRRVSGDFSMTLHETGKENALNQKKRSFLHTYAEMLLTKNTTISFRLNQSWKFCFSFLFFSLSLPSLFFYGPTIIDKANEWSCLCFLPSFRSVFLSLALIIIQLNI